MNKQYYTRHEDAVPFVPHAFQTKKHLIKETAKKPKVVLITPDAYADMLAIAQEAGRDEIGWLGTVQELERGYYLIDKIFMVRQGVHVSTTQMTEEGLAELTLELSELEDETGVDLNSAMKFWGHVHPGNSTAPSQQDDDQMLLFDHNEWFIRGIFGREGRAEFTFFDYVNNVTYTDIPWTVYHPGGEEDRRNKWKDEIAEKVTSLPLPVVSHGQMSYYDEITGEWIRAEDAEEDDFTGQYSDEGVIRVVRRSLSGDNEDETTRQPRGGPVIRRKASSKIVAGKGNFNKESGV